MTRIRSVCLSAERRGCQYRQMTKTQTDDLRHVDAQRPGHEVADNPTGVCGSHEGETERQHEDGFPPEALQVLGTGSEVAEGSA